jgi:hypothetical protein
MADVPIVGAHATIATICHPVMQGWTPPLVGPRRRPGESLLYASTRLGLLLCHDAGICLLIVLGLHLLHMQWTSSYKSSSLPRIGSWIAERVSSSCGRKAWQPLHARSGRCAWNVRLVTPVLMLSSGTSSPRHMPLVPDPNNSPTLARCWRNTRFSLPAGDRSGGVGGDTGEGTGACPTSP